MYPRAHYTMSVCIAVIIVFFWNKSRNRTDISIFWLMLLGLMAGSFPDIDSIMQNIIENAPIEGAHRSVYTHSILALLVWPVFLSVIAWTTHTLLTKPKKLYNNFKLIYIVAVSAFFSHLITDWIEYYPSPILFPFSDIDYYGFVPKSIYEEVWPYTIVMWVCIALTGFLLYFYYQAQKNRK